MMDKQRLNHRECYCLSSYNRSSLSEEGWKRLEKVIKDLKRIVLFAQILTQRR